MTAPDLEAIRTEFLNLCGSCDAGIPSKCTCSERDFRPMMLDLVREIERLREAISFTARRLGQRSEFCGETADHDAMAEFSRELREAL